MKKPIYLDNAATTATRPEVVQAMLPYFGEFYGNPSTIYSLGTSSKQAEEQARKIIGDSLGARRRISISRPAAVNRITGH